MIDERTRNEVTTNTEETNEQERTNEQGRTNETNNGEHQRLTTLSVVNM